MDNIDNINDRQVGPPFGVLRMARRMRQARALRGEAGQTPTEYLMIVGIMATIILLAFITFFWETVKGAAKNWSKSTATAVESSKDAPNKVPTQ